MLRHLGVPAAKSEMSFSVALAQPRIEWSGTDLDTLFAQRRNLLRPGFMRMVLDVLRFNREAAAAADVAADPARAAETLGGFLVRGRYSNAFRDWYLVPMAAAIWSCPTATMLEYPFASFARFFRNHGLLQLRDRPQWYTVEGGARRYVDKLAARLRDVRLSSPVRGVVRDARGVTLAGERFDALVLACHSNQALRILGDSARPEERSALDAIGWQSNRAVLHTDASLLPANPRVWSAWNYAAGHGAPDARPVAVHYLINRLQPLPFTAPVIVSLNPFRAPHPASILGEYDYAHPAFGQGAVQAQARLGALQGRQHTWFCGAWTRNGFHEDGLQSAIAVAGDFGVAPPWQPLQAAPALSQAIAA
ncbi:MAG TPA: FAD-dependent oxidoreductase, partial [Burkholderiales bacterium]